MKVADVKMTVFGDDVEQPQLCAHLTERISNQQSAIWNQESGIRNQESGIRNQEGFISDHYNDYILTVIIVRNQ